MIPLRLQLPTYNWFNQCTVAGEGQIRIEYEVFGANFTYPFRGDRGPRFQFSNTTAADVEDVSWRRSRYILNLFVDFTATNQLILFRVTFFVLIRLVSFPGENKKSFETE